MSEQDTPGLFDDVRPADQAETAETSRAAPLADRMRPRRLEDFVGQDELLGQGRLLRRVLLSGHPPSMIFWGPPGCGKTTLAGLVARHANAEFVPMSAVSAGVREIRQAAAAARERLRRDGRRTILFLDEVHRFNKAQQDALLPHVEKGVLIFLGATTENPSFEVNSALLSRAQVHVLKQLAPDGIIQVIQRALADSERGLCASLPAGEPTPVLQENALQHLAQACAGDARAALNALELAALGAQAGPDGVRTISLEHVEEAMHRRALHYDKAGDEHFNLISAFHKSLRGSDPDAALYWMARMLESGEDPLYIARRMVRFASEDVGLAEPRALSMAGAALQAYHFLGSPEGELALAEAALFLATCPKSNAVYRALDLAVEAVREHGALPVPLVIRNAPTSLMKSLGYGRGYLYDHDDPEAYSPQQYLPDRISEACFYRPTSRGFEGRIREFMEQLEEIRRSRQASADNQ